MYSIGKFAKKIGTTTQTLRNWDLNGKLKPAHVGVAGHRRYSEEQANEFLRFKKPKTRINVAYARVSSKKQSDDLVRQEQLLELFIAGKGDEYKIISDVGSGINYNKPGLKALLALVTTNQVKTLYISHKDRLLRFGFELIEEVCKLHDTDIIVINKTSINEPEKELVEDILNIIHVFSCRMNGRRSHINKKIIKELKNA